MIMLSVFISYSQIYVVQHRDQLPSNTFKYKYILVIQQFFSEMQPDTEQMFLYRSHTE